MSERALRAVMCWLAVGVISSAAMADPPVRMFRVTEDGDPVDFASGTTVFDAQPGERVCMEIWLQGRGAGLGTESVGATINDPAAFSGGGTLAADRATERIYRSHGNDAGWVSRAAIGQCEVAALRASDGESADSFGSSVSLAGDVLCVGARYDDDGGINSGAAYVFRRDGMNWVEEAKLTASDAAQFDNFGASVANGDDFVVVGAWDDDNGGFSTGSVSTFRHDGTNWVPKGKLTPSDLNDRYFFGKSVAVSGDYLAVGAPGGLVDMSGVPTRSGKAYVFRYIGKDWVEEAVLIPADGAVDDSFGYSIAISGDILLLGARGDDDAGIDSGSAYVFRRNGIDWVEEAKLIPGDGAEGDYFGTSVSIDGDLAVVGAFLDNDACPETSFCNSGSAYVFRRQGTDWVQEAKLLPRDSVPLHLFGHSVSVSGNYVVVSALLDNVFDVDSGSAYLFRYDGINWIEQAKLLASRREESRFFGFSVDFDSGYVAIGAPWSSTAHGPRTTGDAYVYRILGGPDCDADGINDACEFDCNGNEVADDCDIADGTSQDCNANALPDECEPDCNGNNTADDCDIEAGTSQDCNSNALPDECEPDCNANNAADDCDIEAGTSKDCNRNGIPDECDPDPDCGNDGTAAFCATRCRGVVYDNTTTYTGVDGGVFYRFVGNEITLAGTERVVTNFEVALRLDGAEPVTVNLKVCFFGNDNDGSPLGGQIWCSPYLEQMIESGPPVFFKLDVPNVSVPDTFTWMVLIASVQGNFNTFGLSHFSPPTVGRAAFGHWREQGGPPGDWVVVGNEPPFGAKVTVVECIDLAVCDDEDVCTFDQCVGQEGCTHTPAVYGDLDGDGAIGLFDLFCILNVFTGNFDVCPFHAGDIEPCAGDGDIDLFDLFAILNAFSGVDPCGCS